MAFDEIDSRIPCSKEAAERVLKDCARRKRIQRFSRHDAKTFLAKAHYHLQSAESFQAEGFLDWAVIAYYVGMYMAAKAFTCHFSGKAAKDHGCTISLMLEVLHGKEFAGRLGSARKVFDEEIELLGKVRQYRNSLLYTVTEVKEKDAGKIGKSAFGFVEEIEKLLGAN